MDEKPDTTKTFARNSRLGIASLVLAIATPVLLLIFIAIAVIISLVIDSPAKVPGFIAIIFAFVAPLIHLTGFILGLCGWLSKHPRKFLPVIATIVNALLGISGVLIWILFISNLTWGFR